MNKITKDIDLLTGAIVHLPEKGRTGVLVDKEYILTSSDCSRYEYGKLVGIKVAAGDREFCCEVTALEPESGIAFLTVGSEHQYPDYPPVRNREYPAFDAFRRKAPRVRLSRQDSKRRSGCLVFNQAVGWVPGILCDISPDNPSVYGYVHGDLPLAAIGGPVIDLSGELVGVLTGCLKDDGEWNGLTSIRLCLPHLALPHWISLRILQLAAGENGDLEEDQHDPFEVLSAFDPLAQA